MGSVRFLLAISVVFAHLNVDFLVGGQIAVQGFFIISGFLIALTLHSNQAYRSTRNFYLNRLLRLFPIYLAVLFLAFVFETYLRVKGVQSGNTFDQLPTLGKVFSIFANLSLLGQDTALFMGSTDSNLGFTLNFRNSEILVYKSMLLPQAWSLSLEIYFYLLAPLLFKKKKIAIALVTVAIALRLALIANGIGLQDPWSYRFFPIEISMFIIGMLTYKLYQHLLNSKNFRSFVTSKNIWVTSLLFLYILGITLIPVLVLERKIITIGLIILSLPFLLEFQNTFRFDRKLAELSYPIYIVHILCIEVLSYSFGLSVQDISILTCILYLVVIIIFASILETAISKPFEKVRRKNRNKTT
jgi:peptidoglycan/LPS O-acetylase OafA/YrhL